MGLDVFVSWFEGGEPAPVSFTDVRAAFGAAAGPMEQTGFRITYEPGVESFVYATPSAEGTLTNLMFDKPPAAEQLWEDVVVLLKLGHGLCFWPGDACADGPSVHGRLPLHGSREFVAVASRAWIPAE